MYRLDGERLRRLRDQAGLSQGQLMVKSRVAQPTISRLERNDLSGNVSVDLLMRLAVALGVDPAALIVEDDRTDDSLEEQAIRREGFELLTNARRQADRASADDVLDSIRTLLREYDERRAGGA